MVARIITTTHTHVEAAGTIMELSHMEETETIMVHSHAEETETIMVVTDSVHVRAQQEQL